MNRWKHILAFLVTPLGTPVTFAVWSGIVFEPGSFSAITSSLQSYVILTAPVAYIAALLLGIPAVLIISRKAGLTFPALVIAGILLGAIVGLLTGFHISGYDSDGMFEFFAFDFYSIYAPATISGMVCAIIYWGIRRIN